MSGYMRNWLVEADEPQPRDRILTKIGIGDYAVFGPYDDLPPGHYIVTFDIELLGSSDDGDICAVVDVVADGGANSLAQRFVTVADLRNSRFYDLAFSLDIAGAGCEHRIFVTGAAALSVGAQPMRHLAEAADVDRIAKRSSHNLDPAKLKQFWRSNIRVEAHGDDLLIPARSLEKLATVILAGTTDRMALAEHVVATTGYKGCDENSLFRAFVGTDRPLTRTIERVPLTSSVCHQAHFGYEQYRFWIRALKEVPRYQRKQWEFFYIAQALFEHGMLERGKRGLVFGTGEEQLPALFATFGAAILATDQSLDTAMQGGWAASGQLTQDIAALNKRSICTDRMFSELVSFRPVDMNDIPRDLDGGFDFCWSSCALEHLGSLRHGLDFIENAMRTLKPGGVAVHTTEYNLSSNDDTIETENLILYRRRDIEQFVADMGAKGFSVLPIDWSLGEGFAEMVIDLAPYAARGEPHLRLLAGDYQTTSLGLIIRKH